MELLVESSSRRASAFQIDVRNCCAPLPKQVRDKWKEWETARDANRDTTLEDLASRLKRAEERREEFKLWLASKPKRSAQVRRRIAEQRATRAKRLEEKLAYAEEKRQMRLEHIRNKATTMLQRTELAAERVNERQELLAHKLYNTLNAAENRRLALIEAEKERLSAAHELVVSRLAQVQEKEEQEREETMKQLGAKLVQADNLRSALLTAASVKAGDKVRHAKHVSKMRRLNEERDTEVKRSSLLVKLQTAADRRYEECTIRKAINSEKSETSFLKRQATVREKLRRSSSSRLLQNTWRSFKGNQKTTNELALAVLKSGLTFLTDAETPKAHSPSELRDPFEEFATRLRSPDTINSTKAFLNRTKMKLMGKSKGVHDCMPLLKRLYPKTPKNKLDRYPTRVFLCAYMILNHPEVVFSMKGERESALSCSSKDMIEAFERLVQHYLQPVTEASSPKKPGASEQPSASDLFNAFDDCWVSYLEQFVAWKLHDAAGLADSLIRMAGKMYLSMLRKVEGDVNSDKVRQNSDLRNIVKQVDHDHCLLRERVERLAGQEGIKKFNQALEDAKQKYETESSEAGNEDNTATESDTSTISRNRSDEGSSRREPRRGGGGGRDPRRHKAESESEGGIKANSGNEAFVWELLYDRKFQLESKMVDEVWATALAVDSLKMSKITPEEAAYPAAALQKQITTIAEKAFWDSVEAKLVSESGDAAVHVCTMLLEVGADLSAMLPNTASAKVVNDHLKDEAELLKLLQGDDQSRSNLNAGGLLHLLEHTSELLSDCGSEARSQAALEAQKKVRDSIVKALEEGERGALAKAVCKGLRLVYAQLKVLRFDLANVRIRGLASVLTGQTAIKYAQDKFSDKFGLESCQEVKEKLPKTKEWIERAVEDRRSLELVLEPLSNELLNSSRANVPASMITGTQSAWSKSAALEQWPEVQYISPVTANSWRTAFRIALIHLVSSPMPLTAGNVPETLQLDVQRLHNAQNAFQRLVVTSASLLSLQQVKGASLPKSELLDMKGRLSAILESPDVNLSTLTSELTSMAGADSDAEVHINNTLINLINREKGGFKALNNGLTKAMGICLVAGDLAEALSTKKAIEAMLSKIGSVYLFQDVMAVAHDLSLIAGINEAVHAQIYESMFNP